MPVSAFQFSACNRFTLFLPYCHMPNLSKIDGERNLYRNPKSGTYFVRLQYKDDRGKAHDTFKSLKTKLKPDALKKMSAWNAAQAAADLGIAIKPRDAAKRATVRAVIERYVQNGYPDKTGIPRSPGLHLRAETDYCATMLLYFRPGPFAEDLDQDALDNYKNWRVQRLKETCLAARRKPRGNGLRTTDLELNTLSNAMNWAVRKKMIKINPIAKRIPFRRPKEVRHCKEMAAENIDEVHEIGGKLFEDRKSEALGWQYLFENLTGLRNSEALKLRMDARADEPGGITADGKSLCIYPVKQNLVPNPYTLIHEGLRQVIDAHKTWHEARYPDNPYYFPGRHDGKLQPVGKRALTGRLDDMFKAGKLRKKFTSHGGRGFYVLVRRSQGAADNLIAWEINHVAGTETLERVYGGVPEFWRTGGGPRYSWTPKGPLAWTKIKPFEKNDEDGVSKRSRGIPDEQIVRKMDGNKVSANQI